MATLMFMFAISVFAGFIDAIAGGGGLILLPSLLFIGVPPGTAIATNKLFNVVSSFTSAYRFYVSKTIYWPFFAWMILPALVGSLAGSRLLGLLSQKAAEPVIAILLIAVAALVLLKRNLGQDIPASAGAAIQAHTSGTLAKLAGAGLLIGLHDGFFGPGAGIFLIFSMIHFGSASFLRATSTAKAINFLTSLVALISFILLGKVNWTVGLTGSAGVMIGSYLGAGFAGAKGNHMIRPIFLGMALAIAVKVAAGV